MLLFADNLHTAFNTDTTQTLFTTQSSASVI